MPSELLAQVCTYLMLSALLINYRQHWNLILILLKPVLSGGYVSHLKRQARSANRRMSSSLLKQQNSRVVRWLHLHRGACQGRLLKLSSRKHCLKLLLIAIISKA